MTRNQLNNAGSKGFWSVRPPFEIRPLAGLLPAVAQLLATTVEGWLLLNWLLWALQKGQEVTWDHFSALSECYWLHNGFWTRHQPVYSGLSHIGCLCTRFFFVCLEPKRIEERLYLFSCFLVLVDWVSPMALTQHTVKLGTSMKSNKCYFCVLFFFQYSSSLFPGILSALRLSAITCRSAFTSLYSSNARARIASSFSNAFVPKEVSLKICWVY